MRRLPTDAKQAALGLDYLAAIMGVFCVLMAFVLFTHYADPVIALAVKCLFAPILVFSALLFHPLFLGGIHLNKVSPWDFTVSSISGSGAFIVLIALAAFRPLATVALESMLFYGNMAIAEEFFFSYFLFAYFLTFMDPFSASIVDGVIFSGYHLAVYGFNPELLIFAFAARIVFCLVYRYTRNLSAAIGPHVLINVLASGSGLVVLGA